jgi:hypothetical protein
VIGRTTQNINLDGSGAWSGTITPAKYIQYPLLLSLLPSLFSLLLPSLALPSIILFDECKYGFVRVMADVTEEGSGVYTYLPVPLALPFTFIFIIYLLIDLFINYYFLIQAQGSRLQTPGYITYSVVPDPTTRKLFPASKSRFGMCAGFGDTTTDTMALLGTRWYYGGYQWADLEPSNSFICFICFIYF